MTVPKLNKKSRSGVKSSLVRFTLYAIVISFCFAIAIYIKSFHTTVAHLQEYGDHSEGEKINSIRGKTTESGNTDTIDMHDNQPKSLDLPEILTLKTSQGDLRIKLRPDLSRPSVEYIKALLDDPKPCRECQFYRAEKPGIFQGVLKKKHVKPNTILGDCPKGLTGKKHECPEHDPNCGCHGPVMTKGMIGWAAGEGGPDFFIDTYERPATWWNTDHTVWGELADKESLDVVVSMYELPVVKGALTMLATPIPIEIQ